jgi:predicted TIM-barrel fold metal-dependent hydrolase
VTSETGLVDVHTHHYLRAYLDACRRPDSGFTHYIRDDGRIVVLQDGAVALAVPQPLPGIGDRLGAMDSAGVRLQVLSISAPNVYALPRSLRAAVTRDCNDELEAIAATANGRLRVFASVPLPEVDDALTEADRALALRHTAGLMLCTTIARRTLDDPVFAPFFEHLSRRGTVVFVHPTTACCTEGLRDYALSLALDFLAETTNAIGRLVYSGTFDRFPGIRWIFSHLGGSTPFVMHRFDNYASQFPEARAHISRKPSEIIRSLTFDTVTTHRPALRCALDTFDEGQLVFGSDYPHVPGGLQVFVDTFDSIGMPAGQRAAIGWRNAEQLLGLR